MKKAIIIALVLVMVLSFAGCKKQAAEDTAAVEALNVRVVVDPTWPPFESLDEKTKEMTGFDIDIMKAIAENQGFTVEFINQAFDTAISSLASCQYDASISAITITEERQAQMLFSEPYFTSGQILTVKEGNENLNTKEALKGKTIGVQTGTTGALMAQEWQDEGNSTMKGYDTVDLAFLDLKNGQVDATLTDDTVAKAYSESLGGLVTVGDLFSSEHYGIAICKTNTDLQSKVNAGLAAIKENGTWDKIYNQYFGAEAQTSAAE